MGSGELLLRAQGTDVTGAGRAALPTLGTAELRFPRGYLLVLGEYGRVTH